MKPLTESQAILRAKHAVDALSVGITAKFYADAVRRHLGDHAHEDVVQARLQLCNSIIALIDDGDAWQDREDIMDEFRLDENGNPRTVETI